MKHKTMLSLATVHQLCIAEEKTKEQTLQLMQDATGQSLDTCNKYFNMEKYHHRQLFEEVNIILSIIDRLDTQLYKLDTILPEIQIYEVISTKAIPFTVKSNLPLDTMISKLSEIHGLDIIDSTILAKEDYPSEENLDFIIMQF